MTSLLAHPEKAEADEAEENEVAMTSLLAQPEEAVKGKVGMISPLAQPEEVAVKAEAGMTFHLA
jgi:hypothetical protein